MNVVSESESDSSSTLGARERARKYRRRNLMRSFMAEWAEQVRLQEALWAEHDYRWEALMHEFFATMVRLAEVVCARRRAMGVHLERELVVDYHDVSPTTVG
jgi:hypothetical protein